MDESKLRSRFRKAIGQVELPRHLRHDTRAALKRAAHGAPSNQHWVPGVLATFLALVTVGTLVGVAVRFHVGTLPSDTSTASCSLSSLVVAGVQGERLHPTILPTGFVLTSGNEEDLGAMNVLSYSAPGSGDRAYVEIRRYITAQPVATLVGGSETSIAVQGKPAVLASSQPTSDWTNIAWSAADNVVLILTGYRVPQTDLLAVANSVAYQPGTPFVYPAGPPVAVTRQMAIAGLQGSDPGTKAALTSAGELNSVLHRTVSTGAEYRPVWVVWGAASSSGAQTQSGIVVDASSSVVLATLSGVDGAALSSLTDRSQGACEPPFGVLTRTEFTYLAPLVPGTVSNLKLMTLGTLRSSQNGATLGNCAVLTCDPNIPVWVWTATATDWRLVTRVCPPPTDLNGKSCQTPPPGSWQLRAFDARTGPQTSALSGTVAAVGPLPAELIALPDLAPSA